jgi:hypothetical protein
MELSAEQGAKFRDLCKEIKPGEYGRVIVSFVGEPSNLVQITGEKNYRFQYENFRAEPNQAPDQRSGPSLCVSGTLWEPSKKHNTSP